MPLVLVIVSQRDEVDPVGGELDLDRLADIDAILVEVEGQRRSARPAEVDRRAGSSRRRR